MNTSHYPSLDLCKKLTEAGFPPTREYNYVVKMVNENPDIIMIVFPSVMELLDSVPPFILKEGTQGKYLISMYFQAEQWTVCYGSNKKVRSATLPNALAEMWLWLKENGYLLIK